MIVIIKIIMIIIHGGKKARTWQSKFLNLLLPTIGTFSGNCMQKQQQKLLQMVSCVHIAKSAKT